MEERRGDVRQLGADDLAQQVLKRASRDSKVAAGFYFQFSGFLDLRLKSEWLKRFSTGNSQ